MSGRMVGAVLAALMAAIVAVAILAGGSGDEGDSNITERHAADTTSTTSSRPSTAATQPDDDEHPDAACGVSLAEVQALLPAASGVTENSTPDPGRCNFTWDDGGPRGIDVAIVAGGRASFEVPAGYQPLDGYGKEAFLSTTDGRASAFTFVGDDLYAADVIADGAGPAEADLRDLCLVVLDLALD